MKNVIIALSLFFALGASAQTKTKTTAKAVTTTQKTDPRATTIETAAEKDLNALIAFTPVNSQLQSALKDLFMSKHSLLKDIAGFSPERKTVVTESVEYRLSILLEPTTFEKLKSNKDLYSSLIN